MLVNCLLFLSACLSYGVSSYDKRDKNEYTELLSLLYERYKLYKRDEEAVSNEHYQYHQRRRDKKENVDTKDDHESRRHHDRTVDSTKRNNVEYHIVTPVHDDDNTDDVEKRGSVDGLPKMDIITPVHDDDEEDASQKHIVPIHDDIDNRKGNILDDSKTYITVVEKKGSTVANNVIDDGDNAKDENHDIYETDGTFHIKNMNNHEEENVVEIDGGEGHLFPESGAHLINGINKQLFPEAVEHTIDGKPLFPEGGGEHLIDGNNKQLIHEVVEHLMGGNKHPTHEVVDKFEKPNKQSTTESHNITMPQVSPKTMDTYLCYAYKLPKEDRYIVEYQPVAEKQVAHHMLLFGCEEPFQETGVWSCREMSPVCKGGGQSIMYAWAKNAPSLKMPTNVGFHVGGNSGFNYLVLQVHYLHVNKFKDGKTDASGIRFVLDKVDKRYLAGIYLLADGFTPIPPHVKKSYIDMGCFYPEGPKFFPFRFRVHAHKLGTVITGYQVRNGNWTLIGRGDPQRPQAFFPVFNDIDIKPGDTIMGRCTYNSTSRDRITFIGATHSDEMCNFYIMYFYDSYEYSGRGQFPCKEVSSRKGSLFEKFPNDSDISLSTMEEANRLNFAKYGVRDMAYSPVHEWPYDGLKDGDLPLTVGQISGVALTADQMEVVIVHRADRYWGQNTFTTNNVLADKYQETIKDNTLIWLDRTTGAITKFGGRDMFYLPHGITIDDEGNIWITDVGSHEVFKLSPQMKILFTLGHRFYPGSGDKHFCKPTDVAVMKNGHFYVADGYCNNRVVKFNSVGKMLLQISGDKNPNKGLLPKPKFMSVVHSLSLDYLHKCLFVADREHGRILVFNSTNGKYLTHIKVSEGAVYAVAYNRNQGGVLHFVTGPLNDTPVTLRGYTYSFYSNSVVSNWAPEGGFSLPHDLAVSRDNQHTFVAEINPFKIWKFARKSKTRP